MKNVFYSLFLIAFLTGCGNTVVLKGQGGGGALTSANACVGAGGEEYAVGESWQCADGCNTCLCSQDLLTGEVYTLSTQMGCLP